MKNKHLVMLFFAVLILGLIRYLPVRYRPFFRNELIRVDTAVITQCIILAPGQPELSLERTETGWVADQNGRVAPVAASDMTPLLDILAGLPSLRTVKTSAADTVGLSDSKKVRVRVYSNSRLLEYFELGDEIRENNQWLTYLQLPLHEGIYLAHGQLRRLFARSLDDFRSKMVVAVTPEAVRRIGISATAQDTLVFFEKNDSLKRWISTDRQFSLSDDSVQAWMALFNHLNNSPFADNFDESQSRDALLTVFRLETTDNTGPTLQFYALKPPHVPEDISELRRQRWRHLPLYVVHSSENPMNYFAIPDTNLAHFLCHGLWRPSLPFKKERQ